jgi:hypothetical protein
MFSLNGEISPNPVTLDAHRALDTSVGERKLVVGLAGKESRREGREKEGGGALALRQFKKCRQNRGHEKSALAHSSQSGKKQVQP